MSNPINNDKERKTLEMNESLHHFFDDFLLILSSHKESKKCEAVRLVKNSEELDLQE